MRGLLFVTLLIVVVLIILPPARSSQAPRQSDPEPGVLSSIGGLLAGLRDLLYSVGEAGVSFPAAVWRMLPERLKPLLGLLVLAGSVFGLIGFVTLNGASRLWHRISD